VTTKEINSKLKSEIKVKVKEREKVVRFEKLKTGFVSSWRKIKDKFKNIFKKKEKPIKVTKISDLRKRQRIERELKRKEKIKNIKYKLGDRIELGREKLKKARNASSKLSHNAFMEIKKKVRKEGKKGEIDPESFVHEIKNKIKELECKNKWLRIILGDGK
jgi:hypothetical protein